MRIKKLLLMMVLLTIAGGVYADGISVDPVTLKSGEASKVPIKLSLTSETYSALQFDLVLPKGITVATNNNKLRISLVNSHRQSYYDEDTEQTVYSHVLTSNLSASDEQSNTYTVVIYDSDNQMLKSGDGAIANCYLLADATVSGQLTAQVKNILLASSGGAGGTNGGTNLNDVSFTITLPAAAITVTAKSYSRVYGAANPDFDYDVEGGTLTGTPAITCVATAESAPGEYDIVIAQGTVTNSNVTYVNGKLTITKATPVVTAPTAIEGTLTYNGSAQTLVSAGSTTGGELQYALSAGGTYSATLPTGTNAGDYTIYYKVVGGTNYNDVDEAGPVNKSIAQKALTITADTKSKVYGDADPELTYTSEGLVGTDAITGELTRTAGESVGEYDITQGTLTAGGNYEIGYIGAKLTITQKEAALAWSNTTFTYTGAEQKPKATVTNLVGNDVCTVTVSGATNAGNHTSTATELSNANYKLPEAKTQAFTIAKAALTISGGMYVMKQGEDLPLFQAEFFGFVNNETNTVLTTQPSLTTEATSNSAVGTYDVNVSGAEAANYEISYQKGSLSIYKVVADEGGTMIFEDESGYNISVDEENVATSESGVIANENLDANGSIAVVSLSYTRELDAPSGGSAGDATIDGSAANLYTTCLADVPKKAVNAKYYTLDAANSTTLTFTEVANSNLAANTPYLVAVTSGSDLDESQNLTNVTLKKEADNSIEKNGFVFKGTLTGLTNAEAAAAGAYILQDGNVWGKVTTDNTNAYIPAFRAYIVPKASDSPALLNGNISEGNMTSIQNIRTVDQDGTEHWYDLNGRRIAKPTRKGLYIINGRKEVVK